MRFLSISKTSRTVIGTVFKKKKLGLRAIYGERGPLFEFEQKIKKNIFFKILFEFALWVPVGHKWP